jgi:hypothetical protein
MRRWTHQLVKKGQAHPSFHKSPELWRGMMELYQWWRGREEIWAVLWKGGDIKRCRSRHVVLETYGGSSACSDLHVISNFQRQRDTLLAITQVILPRRLIADIFAEGSCANKGSNRKRKEDKGRICRNCVGSLGMWSIWRHFPSGRGNGPTSNT